MFNILLSLDKKLFIPSLNLINSIIKNNKNVCFYILISDSKEEYEILIKNNFPNHKFTIRELEQDIDFLNEHIEIMKEYAAEKTKYIFNIMNFARFYLPVVFKEINIGIYLDIDMICRKPFFHILKEFNFFKNDFNILSPLILNCREMGLDKIGFYGKAFNAGFMVWNLKKYREQHLIKKFRQLVKFHNENRIWKLGTQPILNILYYNKVIDINKNWNRRGFGRIITSEKEKKKYDKNSKSAFIIHWNSQYKPWDYSEVAAFEIWNKYSLTNNYSN